MLFPTLPFAVFFAIVLPASWLLMPHRVRWRVFMVGASWFFYGTADWRFVVLLAGSTVGNHVFARQIDRRTGKSRSAWTAGAVTANLVVLGWFKYIGFLALSGQSLLNLLGLPWKLPLPEVALPIAISFFTFQALSYVIDTARGKVRPGSLLDFAVYLSFFPHLVAGPIVRASEFLPQIRRRIDPRKVDAGKALWLISLGLFKKVVIASYLASKAADPLFGFPHQHGGPEAMVGVYAYAIQIYADFSGYTDIAIGLALLLGIQFPQNFNAPYAAYSLQDFWRRWHMTLSRWLRDYLYIPLGGNRRSRSRTYANLMLTMLLGGLWHGASWTFVVWGGLHGVGLGVERGLQERRQRRRAADPGGEGGDGEGGSASPPSSPSLQPSLQPEPAPLVAASVAASAPAAPPPASAVADGPEPEPELGPPASAVTTAEPGWSGPVGPVILPVAPEKEADPEISPRRLWLGRLVTFHLVCLAWIFFRATSFHNAIEVMSRLLPTRHGSARIDPLVVAVVAAAIAAQLLPSRWAAEVQARFSRLSVWAQAGWVAGALIGIDLLGPAGVAPFIYFRF